MNLAIMQPYFMPYLGYFALIKQSDTFILFDTPQFIRHGWIERNRMLALNGEPFYIKAPLLKHSRDTLIQNIKIDKAQNWEDKIFAQLNHYKKRTRYYNRVIDLLQEIFNVPFDNIVELNCRALQVISEYLEIGTPISVWSKMNLEIEAVHAPDEWALNICKALNAEVYYNLPGGKTFFDKTKYDREGIDLKFLDIIPKPYKQFDEEFIPFLSILDAMMFCDVNQINELLNSINVK